METISIVEVVAFFIISLSIGALSRGKKNVDDYLIGGRDLGIFRSVMTICGSFVGAMTLLVYTAFVYTFGISALWIFVGYLVGFVVFIPFAVYLKEFSQTRKYYTLVDFFKEKYNRKVALFILSAVFIWYFGTLSAQFIGSGKILEELSGIPYRISTVIICFVIISYLLIGGFRSVVLTDVFQFIMIGVILLIVVYVIQEDVRIPAEHWNLFNAGVPNIIAFLLLGLATPFATQDFWQKIYAMRDKRVVKWSFTISGVILFSVSLFLTYIGLIARTKFPGIDADIAAIQSFTSLVPEALKGIVGIAFFAAILSTADTFLFMLSVNTTHDSVKLRKEKREEKIIHTRIAVIVIGVLAMFLALSIEKIVDITMVFKSVGLVVAPIVIFTWRKVESKNAVMISVGSMIVVVLALAAFGFVRPELLFVGIFGAALLYGVTLLVEKLTRR